MKPFSTVLLSLLLLLLVTGCDPAEEATRPADVPPALRTTVATEPPVPAGTTAAVSTLTPVAPSPAAPAPPLAPPARTVMVHLFEWTWPDVAQECEQWLGPAGYVAVQVSPPQEHVRVPGDPWWQRYQPVSYQLESRSGTREQFAEMVERCGAAGVDVYVDAVINHMTGMDEGVGTAGTRFSHYEYPGLYGYDDFHHCGSRFDDIHNYQDAEEVQSCELLNLADLDTGAEQVRQTIAAYLNDLVSLGVDGFRIDAAKHTAPADLAAILALVEGEPYIFQEVIDQGGEPIQAEDYTALGDVTEFQYGLYLGQQMRRGQLAELEQFGEAWEMLPSTEAVVFVNNHDNQRGHGGGGAILTYNSPELYTLANVFMLAWPYGYPRVMSSYAFEDPDAGPPAGADGQTDPVYGGGPAGCFEGWVCEHRWPAVIGMVGFHNYTSPNFYVTDWWSNGSDVIAFGRGELGFVVINGADQPLEESFQTSMAPGHYCNVAEGTLLSGESGCPGSSLVVDAEGRLSVRLPPLAAAAIHVGAVDPAAGD